MATRTRPRRGSLQFWPRKRASKFLPSVNWSVIPSENSKGLKGFICYKAGMASAYVKDNTPNSMTKDKQITIPVTILECPSMKIFSVRFCKNGKVARDILSENIEKELKKKIKVPKAKKFKLEEEKTENYDDVSVIVYSQVKKTGIKKTPDLTEIALTGANIEEKLTWIKENLNKEILISNIFENKKLVDLRGLTKGKGHQGPIKRFGAKLRFHKSEKGQRKIGSIGPWHPARVTFRAPMAGQMGLFTRVVYNNKIIEMAKASDKPIKNIKNYGDLKNDYVLVYGSVQGPAKRQLLMTAPLRKTKKQNKKDYNLVRLMR